MSKGLTNKDISLLEKVFREFSAIEEVIIFGSRAMGNCKSGSDVDFAIKWKGIDSFIVRSLHSILEEEIPEPYFFDIVDYASITTPELKEYIDGCGKVFYLKG